MQALKLDIVGFAQDTRRAEIWSHDYNRPPIYRWKGLNMSVIRLNFTSSNASFESLRLNYAPESGRLGPFSHGSYFVYKGSPSWSRILGQGIEQSP
jgi:hypothetical protein